MKKILFVAAIIILVFAIVTLSQSKTERNVAFHITLTDPKLYVNGTFSENFTLHRGSYQFSFVPNGDSPQILSISLNGDTISYMQDFKLNGAEHNTGISTYYTWDYLGTKIIDMQQDQDVLIKIDPHGNLLGTVSIDLIKR